MFGGGGCGLPQLVVSFDRWWRVWGVAGSGVLFGMARWLVLAENVGLRGHLFGTLLGLAEVWVGRGGRQCQWGVEYG